MWNVLAESKFIRILHVIYHWKKIIYSSALDFHTVNVAQLQICGSIAGTIQKCQGAPTSTTGESGNVRFTIKPVEAGATINISKGRWERTFALPYLKLIRVLIAISWQRVSELPLRFAGKTSHSLQLLLGEQAPETLMLL